LTDINGEHNPENDERRALELIRHEKANSPGVSNHFQKKEAIKYTVTFKLLRAYDSKKPFCLFLGPKYSGKGGELENLMGKKKSKGKVQ